MLQVIPAAAHGPRGIARATLIVGVATLATAWLAIWVDLLGAGAGTAAALPGPALEGLVLAGAALAWRLVGAPLGERWARAIFVVVGVVAALLVVWVHVYASWIPLDPRWPALAFQVTRDGHGAPLVYRAITALVLWGVGGRIGAAALDDYDVFRYFVFGLAGLFAGLLARIMAGIHGPAAGGVGIAVALFFAAALLTLPLAQLLAAQARGRATGAPPIALDHRWVLTAGGTTMLILGLALLLSGTISGSLLGVAAAGLGKLPDLLVTVLYPLILAGGYLVEALIWLFHQVRGTARAPQHVAPPLPPPPRTASEHQVHMQMPPVLHFVLELAAIAVIAAIVASVLGRAIGRLGALRHEQTFEEERESVWSWTEARLTWRSLFTRLRPRRGAKHPAARGGPPQSAREAYRLLLRGGTALGHPRANPETPREYLGRLRDVPIPDERDAALLTAAYTRVHYGDQPEHDEEVEQVARAWERLDQAMRRQPPHGK